MTYPDTFPRPLRAQYGVELNPLTQTTQMQSGYIVQRRMEPYIFRKVNLAFNMRLDDFYPWFAWAHRYGYDFHEMTIQGDLVELRYIGDIQYNYEDYARVLVSVQAEQRLSNVVEEWVGSAPDFYDPQVTNTDGLVDGSFTPDIDLNSPSDPFDLLLDTVPKEQTIRTSVRVGAVGNLYAYAAGQNITLDLYDLTGTTLLDSGIGVLRWHTDPARTDAMTELVAGEDYLVRITGTLSTTINVWAV